MIISRAPVRLSMGGGGTDLASYYSRRGGFVLAFAINKYVFINANRRFQNSIRLSYSKTEIVSESLQIEHNIFRETLKLFKIQSGIELVSVADVPSNCGLGTSSAFTVAVLNALACYQRQHLSLQDLAEQACHIEINVLEAPIGKQDQYAAAFGGINAYWYEPDGKVIVEPLQIKDEVLFELQNNMMLFYLNSERSANVILHEQNSKSIEGDVATIERLDRIKEIGLQTKKLFESGQIDDYGDILHQHWLTKKGLSDKVSQPFIDEAYEWARKHGATGGKVVGAGGGGFLLLYCPRERVKLVEAMKTLGLAPMWFNFEREGAKIVYHQ